MAGLVTSKLLRRTFHTEPVGSCAAIDPRAVNKASEQRILAAGGQILASLPHLDADARSLRPRAEVLARALIMNAMINIAFKAQIEVIAGWIHKHQLDGALVESERQIPTGTT